MLKNRAVYLVHVLMLILCSHESYAKIAVTRLDCGKQIAGIAAREEMALSGSIYTVGVTFLGQGPRMSEIDRVLREAIAALKIDSKKDILATPWFRANANDILLKQNARSLRLMSAIVFDNYQSLFTKQSQGGNPYG